MIVGAVAQPACPRQVVPIVVYTTIGPPAPTPGRVLAPFKSQFAKETRYSIENGSKNGLTAPRTAQSASPAGSPAPPPGRVLTQRLGCRLWGMGFVHCGLGFRVWGLGFSV